MNMRLASLLCLLCLPSLATACGGGGGGDGDNQQQIPSYVQVVFPPPACNTEEGTLRIRGVSTGLANVTSVDVGGVAAASTDGFNSWFVTVPLAFGLNTMTVTATDDQGDTDPGAFPLQITRSVQTGPVASMDYDPAGNRVVLLHAAARRLLTKDLTTGDVRILSGSGVGSGVAFANPRHVVFDTANNRVIVSDQEVNDLIVVDLVTGNRSTFTNTFFNSPDAMVLDPGGNRVLVTETTIDAVVGVNLTTGVRTTLSDAVTGTGTDFSLPTSIVHDPATGTAYVLDASVQAILAVDLSNGNRTIVADKDTGTGGQINSSTAIALDVAGNRIFLSRSGFHRVHEVDIATGDHPLLLGENGIGPALEAPGCMILTAPNQLLIGQGGATHLLAVNTATDVRTVAHDWSVGQGPAFERVTAVGFDPAHNRILVADELLHTLFAVNGDTGNRSVFIQGMQPAGDFQRPQRMRVDANQGVAHVYGINPTQIVTVDLDTAAMTVVSRLNDIGAGESMQFARDLCYDPTGARYFVTRGLPDVILDVDETTGNRTIFADAATGSGTATSSANSLSCDPANGRLYYRQRDGGALVNVINIATGVRTVVTDNTNTGPSTSGAGDMRLDAGRNRLVVFGARDAAAVALDLTTGNREELAGPTIGGGLAAALITAGDIFRSANLGVCYDANFRSIVVIDLSSGDRVTLSR